MESSHQPILQTAGAAKAPFWKNEKLWVSLLTAALPFLPPVGAVLLANPELQGAIVGGLFMLFAGTKKAVKKVKSRKS